jgi:multidrug efflux pump subunit AcrB
VTVTVTKKPGENAVDVARAARARVDELRNTVIPPGIETSVTRDYGETAAEKANKLIQKLAFATGSVILLVGLALGRREAVIVGGAVILTLTATLFASWAWGFTLNRVSLFALIFSIGILVDDAIVVVENIHRHQQLTPHLSLREIIPAAVDEVGGPTILATLTVIAALLPMAFVTGLMGPYMGPIPINASLGMALSLAIAFTVTPWLALKLMKSGDHAGALHTGEPAAPKGIAGALGRGFAALLRPFLDSARKRWLLLAGIVVALMLSVGLAAVQWVVMKMLPFDNKSEFALVVDMPAGTPLEDTAAALQEMGGLPGGSARGARPAGLRRHGEPDHLQRSGAPVLPARRRRDGRAAGQPGRQTPPQRAEPCHRAAPAAGAAADRRQASGAAEGRRSAARPAGDEPDRRRGLRPRRGRPPAACCPSGR